MPVGDRHGERLRRRVAIGIVAALVVAAGATQLPVFTHAVVAQALEPPTQPEDYLARGRTSLLAGGMFQSGRADETSVGLSADGRFVVFETWSSFDPLDQDRGAGGPDLEDRDVYLLDRDLDGDRIYDEPPEVEGQDPYELISVGFELGSGEVGIPISPNRASFDPQISPNGEFVTFRSLATNLTEDRQEDEGEGLFIDVFRWTRSVPWPAVLVSEDLIPGEPDPSLFFSTASEPTVADNGNVGLQDQYSLGEPIVASAAAAPPGVNNVASVWVRDFAAEVPEGPPVYRQPQPLASQSDAFDPVISADGRFLAYFARIADNPFDDVPVRADVATGTPTPLPVPGGTYEPESPSISGDGNLVTYETHITNIETDQVYLVNVGAGTPPELLSRDATGQPADFFAGNAVISTDGRYVAFLTYARNLFGLGFGSLNALQVVVRDLANPLAGNELVSVGEFIPDGSFPTDPLPEDFLGNSDSWTPAVSSHPGAAAAPGNRGMPRGLPFVAFRSSASNLDDGGDFSFDDDLYVRSFTSARLIPPSGGVFDFGDGPIGVAGNVQSIPFATEPTGFGPLAVTGLVFSEPGGPFTVIGSQCDAVDPGRTCLVSVQFLPTLAGPAPPGSLTVSYDTNPTLDETPFEVPDPLVLVIVFLGRGTLFSPVVVLNPTSVAFGDRTIGTTGPATAVTVSLTPGPGMTASVVFTDIRVAGLQPGDYRLDATGCLNVVLLPGSSCAVTVTFTPTAIGARAAVIEFRTGPSDPAPRFVTLTGNGIQPTITLNPAVVHSGGVIGVKGLNWPPGKVVRLSIPGVPKVIDLTVQPDGTVELPTVIFRSRSFGPRDVMAEVVGDPAVRLAQPVILLVQAPGSNVVDIIGRN